MAIWEQDGSRVCGTAPKFYGKRGSRGKYFWLRRKLGREKKLRAIKRIGYKERRIVNDETRSQKKSLKKQRGTTQYYAILPLEGLAKAYQRNDFLHKWILCHDVTVVENLRIHG